MGKIDIIENELTPKQEEIYLRLNEIGKEIAAFYSDGIRIINNSQLQTKSNLLAHIAREIDGGLRDILSSKSIIDKTKNLSKEEITKIKEKINTELESKGLEKIDTISDHVISVCNALNLNDSSQTLIEWIICSSQFHKFAHRHGAYTSPRDFKLFQDVWNRYEEVLYKLIGSYYNLLDRIDDLLKKPSPSEEIIKTLPNLFKIEAREVYFFSNLKQIGWLKRLNEAGFFDPKNNPEPQPAENGKGYYILYWSPLRYLDWISENVSKDDKDVINELVKIIDKIMGDKDEKNRRKNYRTDFSIFKIIKNIPSNFIKESHIEFIRTSLGSDFHNSLIGSELSKGFIDKLIKEDCKNLLLKLVDVICSYKKVNSNVESLIEEYWFSELIKKYKTKLAQYSAKEIIEILIKKINEIKREDKESFNVVWIPTIESHEQKSFPDRYDSQLIDLLVECLIQLNGRNLIGKSKYLLNHEFPILRRVGIYLVNLNFETFNGLLFNLKYNPLGDSNLKHEIYELLKSNATKFSDEQIKIIIRWIEGKNYYIKDIKPEEQKEILAYRKKEWYSPLLPSKNKDIQKLHEEYNKINDKEPEHPGFVSWHTTWCGEVTPLQEFELEKASITKIVTEIKQFKEEKGIRKPSVRGFADTLQKDVEKNPSKYYDALDELKDVDLAYLCAVIRGLINICKKNNDKKEVIIVLDWEKILKFIDEKINEDFWKIKLSGEFNYPDWFISEVSNLIEEGTKNDITAFDIKLLPIAKEILLKLTNHKVHYSINNDDFVTFALNSTEGKILHAMLNYSLRFYRVVEKKWDGDIREYFTKQVTEKKYLEVFTIIGEYLPQFNTLDKEWISSNFDSIFPLNDLGILKASSSGLFFNPTVYSNFYSMFKDKGQYNLFLDSWNENEKNLNESVLRHICLGYAEKWEEIGDNTLIKKLLDKKDALDEVVRFFWVIAKNIKPEYLIRVKELWKYIYQYNKGYPIVGKLMEWLRIFKELDEELFDLCIHGAKYVHPHDVDYIIEYLVKFIDTDIKRVGDILLELVKNINMISEYRKEDAIRIVEKLYKNNQKELADRICCTYAEKHNLHFLRQLYNINNS